MRATAGIGALLLAPATLAGCDTTQRRNERAKLSAQREIAARAPQRVTRPSADVRVTRVALVRAGRPAIVVELRSAAARTLTDVPITVGVQRADGRRVVLNARAGMGWFQTHVPAITAHGTATWVFRGRDRLPAGARPYATVGAAPPAAGGPGGALPHIVARALPAGAGARTATVLVENVSDIPQYGLQVYALARAGGRYVAAGKASIVHLGTGASTTVRVPLAGAVGAAPLRVHAVAAMLR